MNQDQTALDFLVVLWEVYTKWANNLKCSSVVLTHRQSHKLQELSGRKLFGILNW